MLRCVMILPPTSKWPGSCSPETKALRGLFLPATAGRCTDSFSDSVATPQKLKTCFKRHSCGCFARARRSIREDASNRGSSPSLSTWHATAPGEWLIRPHPGYTGIPFYRNRRTPNLLTSTRTNAFEERICIRRSASFRNLSEPWCCYGTSRVWMSERSQPPLGFREAPSRADFTAALDCYGIN